MGCTRGSRRRGRMRAADAMIGGKRTLVAISGVCAKSGLPLWDGIEKVVHPHAIARRDYNLASIQVLSFK